MQLLLCALVTIIVIFLYALPGYLEERGESLILPWLLGEDGIYESLGALFCLGASILFLSSLFTNKSTESERRGILRQWPSLVLSVGLFLLFAEEINWGQRLLGIDAPSWFFAMNSGGELAFHVIGDATVPAFIAGVFALASVFYLSIIPFLCDWVPSIKAFAHRIRLPIASRPIAVATLVLFVVSMARVYRSQSGHFWSEQFEMPLQLLFLLFALEHVRERSPSWSTPALWGWGLATAGICIGVGVLMGKEATSSRRVPASYEFIWAMEASQGDRRDETKARLQKVLELDPTHVGALTFLASCHWEEKEHRQAEALLHQAAEHAPTNPTLYPMLMRLHLEEERFAHALDAALLGLRVDPKNFDLRLTAITLLHKLNRRAESKEHFSYLREHLPADHPAREIPEISATGG